MICPRGSTRLSTSPENGMPMTRSHNQPPIRRSTVGFAVAAATIGLTIAAIVWPDWVEVLTGHSPDAGSGRLEWAAPFVLGVVSALTTMWSVFTRRRELQVRPG